MKEDNFAGISPELQSLVSPLKAHIEALQQTLNNKDAEIAHLKEVIETYQRMLFGSKSEKTRYLSQMDQLSLFNAIVAAEKDASQKKSAVVVKEHTREVQPKQSRDDYIKLMIESGKFPVETVLCDVPEEKRFDSVGNPLECLGVEHVRYELEVIPKQYVIKDIQAASYGSKRDKEGKRAEVVEGEVPPAIIPHSPVGASVLTDTALNKCDYGLPLYRQERMMRDMGVPIRRNVMAGWFISTADLVRPLWEVMKDEMKKLKTINADETFGQVLHNATGNPRAQLDFWAYCSGKWELIQMACFEYCSSREGKHAKRFLDGYTGKIITDGCSSYKAIEHLERGGCWSHTRRYWYIALPAELKSKRTKLDKLADDALQIANPEECVQLKCLLLINELFMLERRYDAENLTADARLERRKKECAPILEKYWETVEALAKQNITGKLQKAVTYSLNQRKYLMKFMEHGDMPISNNAVERLIRNLVIGRKNWLFCDTEDGAQAVATLYSIIVTAHVNGLDVRSYFEFVIRSMAAIANRKQLPTEHELREHAVKLLPWNDEMQDRFLAEDPFAHKPYTAKSKAVW